MKKIIFSLVLAAGMLLLHHAPARAGESRRALVAEWLRHMEQDLADAESTLTNKDASEWTQEEVEKYLFCAMYVIYDGVIIYSDTNRTLPTDSEVLRNAGIVSNWPANPFNNWEPIKWENSEFSPGDCVMQECPPELYSGLWKPRPMTFVISINGPIEDYISLHPLQPLTDWSTVPGGSVFNVMSATQPASESRRKFEEMRQRKDQESEDTSEQKNPEDAQEAEHD